jgi:GMP synthase-like glutamine amidotransferase
MYNGQTGRGIPAIEAALAQAGYSNVRTIDVRAMQAGQTLPTPHEADLWVSSGGPGDPADSGTWGPAYGAWLDALMAHNQQNPSQLVRAWLICHSFQVASCYWQLGVPQARPQGLLEGIYPQQDIEGQTIAQTWESRYWGIYGWQATHFAAKHLVFLSCDTPEGALSAWTSLDGAIVATQYHPEVAPEIADQIIAEANLVAAEGKLLQPMYRVFTSFLCGAKVATL